LLSRIAGAISSFVNYISAWGLFVLMATGIVGIIARLAGAPMSGIISLSIFIFIGSVYLSFAYAQLRGNHISVELFVGQLSSKYQRVMRVVTVFLSAVGCSLLVWALWPYAWESLMVGERMSGEPYYPIYPAKISAAVGSTVFLLQLVADLVRGIKLLKVDSNENARSGGMEE
jgi:TRAP-type mannitol/chloroaromatic compound transport system permease small subunit